MATRRGDSPGMVLGARPPHRQAA